MSRMTRSTLIASATAALAIAAPQLAQATTLYVSNSPAPPGNSCGHAGFSEIQTAVDEAETFSEPVTVEICGGTFAEQIEITREISLVGKKGAKITLPAMIGNSGSRCDGAIDALVSQPDQDLLSICGPGRVSISDLTLQAKWPEGTCYDSLYNTLVGGGATLEATKVTFEDAGVAKSSPDVGCQGGVAVQVGFSGSEGSASLTTPAVETGHAVLADDTISEYQKNGVTVDGDGSSATIGPKVTITGDGPVGTGQNGVQVSRGATARLTKVKISDDECSIPSVCGDESQSQWEEDASGVLLYLPGAHTAVESSKLAENNIGLEYISGAESRPRSPELALSKNSVAGGYASLQINQGNAVMEHDTFTGALYGIDVNENAYGGSYGTPFEYAPVGLSEHDTVDGSKASVQVESSLGSLSGELTLLDDHISGPAVDLDSGFTING